MTQRSRIDLTGRRVGRWVVVSFAYSKKYQAFWLCHCDCGTERTVRAGNLLRGLTTSCGCSHRTHGMTKTPIYRIWAQMIARCKYPTTTHYRHYGGRGIRVCDRWLNSFADFYADVGPRPSRRHTLDRMDVDGHYEPGNVRWATPAEQMQSQRRTKLTPEAVLDIRSRATPDNRSELAAEYGVTTTMIDNVARGRAWANIGGKIRSRGRASRTRQSEFAKIGWVKRRANNANRNLS